MGRFEDLLTELILISGRYQYRPRYLKGCGLLSSAEACVLEAIAKNKQINMGSLSKLMHTTRGATTQVVDKLVKRDYLKRDNDKKDRRSIIMELTTAGRKAYRSYTQCKKDLIGDICEGFDLKGNMYPEVLLQEIIKGMKKNLDRSKY